MNIPNTMMRNANSRRGAMRSDGAAAALIIVGRGGGGVRHDLLGSRLSPGPPPDAANHCGWIIIGESRSASLSASAAPSRVSTVA